MTEREFRYCQCSPNCKRKVFKPNNSTIWPKYNPNCILIMATKTRKTKEVPNGQPKIKKERKKPIPWEQKPLNELIEYVQSKLCNPYIRERDLTNFGRCVSSGFAIAHAGHYYSIGSHPGMRLNINNIHGQSVYSNMHKHGDGINYRTGLIKRHGEDYVKKLEESEIIYKTYGYSWDVFNVILIGKTYRYLKDNKIWVYDQETFNDWKEKVQNEYNNNRNKKHR